MSEKMPVAPPGTKAYHSLNFLRFNRLSMIVHGIVKIHPSHQCFSVGHLFSMQKVIYISSSIFPGVEANAIHTRHMCAAYSTLSTEVYLFCGIDFRKRRAAREDFLLDVPLHIRSIYLFGRRGKEPLIALLALVSVLVSGHWRSKEAVFHSRNLIAAFLLRPFLGKQLVYEAHTIERRLRGKLQQSIFKDRNVKKVFISQKMLEIASKRITIHGEYKVLHDAAPEYPAPVTKGRDRNKGPSTTGSLEDDFVVGYIGSLHPGRGVEHIIQIAKRLPKMAFHIYGGTPVQIEALLKNNIPDNMRLFGYLAHHKVRATMADFDCLLMPYQETVSTGVAGEDTSRWMSPLKMFEYMSTGLPIISSDMPVLREVLSDNINAILCNSKDVTSWADAILSVRQDPSLARQIGERAFRDYRDKFTWNIRAKNVLGLF